MYSHSQAAQQAATNAVVDQLDGGTLEILDGATVLAVLTFGTPAFGDAAATGIATANAIGADAAANASGTADAWQAKDSLGNVEVSGAVGMKRAIAAVSIANDTVSIVGDHTTEFAVGTEFSIVGSTGNDGYYTVAAVEFTGGNTVITVDLPEQSIPNATVDGYVHVGEVGLNNTSIAAGQEVSVSAFTYRALQQ